MLHCSLDIEFFFFFQPNWNSSNLIWLFCLLLLLLLLPLPTMFWHTIKERKKSSHFDFNENKSVFHEIRSCWFAGISNSPSQTSLLTETYTHSSPDTQTFRYQKINLLILTNFYVGVTFFAPFKTWFTPALGCVYTQIQLHAL